MALILFGKVDLCGRVGGEKKVCNGEVVSMLEEDSGSQECCIAFCVSERRNSQGIGG